MWQPQNPPSRFSSLSSPMCPISMLHWSTPAAKHVTCLCQWQHWERCVPTLSKEGIRSDWTTPWHHMSSSSSSSWEEPACWVALADAAAICACWAACCICSHSCWASSACCCRACRDAVEADKEKQIKRLLGLMQKNHDNKNHRIVK